MGLFDIFDTIPAYSSGQRRLAQGISDHFPSLLQKRSVVNSIVINTSLRWTFFLTSQLIVGPGVGAKKDHMLLPQGLGVKGIPIFKDASQRGSNQGGLRFPVAHLKGKRRASPFLFLASLGLLLPFCMEACKTMPPPTLMTAAGEGQFLHLRA